MSHNSALLTSAEQHLYPNYAKPEIVIDRGEGARLWDTHGRSYIDLFAGIAVSALGHGHPALVEAICTQAHKLVHVSNYYHNQPNIELAEKLCALTRMDRAFFCNSGTEANEAMLKLARRFFFERGEVDRYRIIAFENSFHGRTLGAMTATGQKKYREGFGPLSGVTHVPFGNLDAVRAAMGADVAAILVEPIQGEGGVVVAPTGFLAGLRAVADEAGCLLLADEIQTGIGRTGRFLAMEHSGVEADAVSLAKALGGGFPIGAMVCKDFLKGALPPGSHGTTYGGGPLASAAALATLTTIEKEELAPRAERLGHVLASRLAEMVDRHAAAKAQRGQGLLQALVLADHFDARQLLDRLREAGVLLTVAGGVALRFSPPLTIAESDLDEGLTIVDRVLGELS